MTLRRCVVMTLWIIPGLLGCAPKRVHIMPEVAAINRVAVINLADRTGKPSAESEFFTNEFVSLGFSVLERGHLREILDEAFTEHGYLDEQTIAQRGRGLGIEGVVLHQILNNAPVGPEDESYEVSGWVRIVDVETGKIVMTYNVEFRAPGSSTKTRAAKLYAERVVDDIRMELQRNKIVPGSAVKMKVQEKVEVKKTPASP